MHQTLSLDDLRRYVLKLIARHIPDGYRPDAGQVRLIGEALERVEYCFSKIQRKYYAQDGQVGFDHLNTDHMATFLYFYANTIWRKSADGALPTRLFYLNKILHGLDLYYSVALPDIFLLVHPVGTVLGHASYQDYFVVYQNCTVGAVTTTYPQFGTGTILYSRTSVLGSCVLGNDVVLAANAMIIDVAVPSSTLVVGQYPTQRLLPSAKSVRERCFDARREI